MRNVNLGKEEMKKVTMLVRKENVMTIIELHTYLSLEMPYLVTPNEDNTFQNILTIYYGITFRQHNKTIH